MTDAYFYQSIFVARLFGSACRSVKGQVVVWETKPLKEALICTESNFQIHSQKFQELPRYHLISRQREKQVSSTVGHDLMHAIPMPKGDLPKRTII
jgi:mevalonate pyrophosphate decarboxylase